jgi:phage anti-repressor protein
MTLQKFSDLCKFFQKELLMGELIKISVNRIGEESVNSVSARDLHNTLGLSKSNFSKWIKVNLLNNTFFTENIDFITVRTQYESIQGVFKESEDYLLTLDTAKHLTMLSRTEKAHKIRNYFIAVEKRYRLQVSETAVKKRTDLISVSDQELDRELKALKFVFQNYNLSEKEKIEYGNRFFERANIPLLDNPHLRKLQPVFTVTELLKEFNVDIRPADFNKKLESFGVIQRSENGWTLVDMRFGENRKFGNTLTPRYYRGEFQKLLEIVL